MRSGKVVLAFSYSLGVLRRLFLGVCHGKVFGKADLLRLVAANGGQYTRRGRGRLQSTVRTEQIRCREEMATDAQVLSRGGNGSPRIQVTGEIATADNQRIQSKRAQITRLLLTATILLLSNCTDYMHSQSMVRSMVP
jgi:hypothetical protein